MIDFLKIIGGLVIGLLIGLSLNGVAPVGGTTNFDDLSVTSITNSGAMTQTGAVTLSSTLGVTGAATLSSTLGVTATTTLGNTLVLNKGTFCITGYATSTATRIKIEFDALAATTTSPIGGLKLNYGSCN